MKTTMTFEEVIDELEKLSATTNKSATALELAGDAIAFAQSIHAAFVDNGMTSSTEVNFSELENLFDALNGELAAAALFLSNPILAGRIPDMLRQAANNIAESDTNKVVPLVVQKGFARLAARMDALKSQTVRQVFSLSDEIKKAEPT
ncbi:hypothetical protein HC928_00065 [bacterium]|nr:hypothetical protein [bacterium]